MERTKHIHGSDSVPDYIFIVKHFLSSSMIMANWLFLQQSHVFMFAILWLLWPCLSTDSITMNLLLQDSQTIYSRNQNFKLQFFSPANSTNRYVGIMFNVPVMTVVWVANRDKPLNDSTGTFTISEDGNLVVLSKQKEVMWSTNIANALTNTTAQLLDSGNLVLSEGIGGKIVWESFQNPTDSYLETMRLTATPGTNEKVSLTSWRSPHDPSAGYFTAGIDLVAPPEIFIWKESKTYWRSGPWDGNVFIGVQEMFSLYKNGFNMVDDNKGSVYLIFAYSNDPETRYYHLDSTGSLQEKVWEPEKQDWHISWSTTMNQCNLYSTCGPYGICNPQDSTLCSCLQGFEPIDEEEYSRGNWTSGCVRRTLLQCQRNDSVSQTVKKDGFVKLTGAKLPDFAEWKAASEVDCAILCLNNCSCMAYASYTTIGCMHWSDSLIDVVQFSSNGADLYVRIAYSELEHKKVTEAVIASTVVAGSLLIITIFAYFLQKYSSKLNGNNKGNNKEEEMSLFEAGNAHRNSENYLKENLKQAGLGELPGHSYETLATVYSYEALATATENFHSENQLGKGGFGQVYKGKLLDGKEIAVKRLSKLSSQGVEEFMNEVFVISKVQHRNLVRLLGCCVQKNEKMLVYEYMPNGSLDAHLFDSNKHDLLDWRRRTAIIEGISRGLLYLHRDSRLKIIHRDLKASNILLDEQLNPKISDFGLAKIFTGNQDQDATRRVAGTYGYMAPEYAMVGTYSEKSDIYSFGVLLLEIVCGRKNSSFPQDQNELSLTAYAWRLWHDNMIDKMIDASIFTPGNKMEASRYIHVGLLCVQELAKDRPNISTVLSMLNSEIAELPPPTLPAFTWRLVSPESENPHENEPSFNDMSVTIFEAR